MKKTKDPILFAFCNVGSFRLQRIMMNVLAASGHTFSAMSIAGNETLNAEVTQAAANWGVSFLRLSDDAVPGVPSVADRAMLKNWLLRSKHQLHAFDIRFQVQRAKLRVATDLLKDLRPTALVVSEDGVSGPTALIAAARQLRIPVVDVPYGNATRIDFENELDRRAALGELRFADGNSGELVAKFFPQWVKKGKHQGALLFDPDYILSLEVAGITLKDAWIVHGGLSDILCVENRVGRQQYLGENIAAEKLRVTGSPYCDAVLAGAHSDPLAREALRQPKRIEKDITRILVSWPPSYHETYPDRCEFSTYAEMTHEALSFLKALPNTKLTLSMHPACSDVAYSVAKNLGLETTKDDLLGLIGTHDVFMTYFSSAIRWALAAGKPVVNYDAYRIGLPTFESAPGFINAASFGDFRTKIEKLVFSDEEFSSVAEAQIVVADDWGLLDGKCTERIFAEIEKLTVSGPFQWLRSRTRRYSGIEPT